MIRQEPKTILRAVAWDPSVIIIEKAPLRNGNRRLLQKPRHLGRVFFAKSGKIGLDSGIR